MITASRQKQSARSRPIGQIVADLHLHFEGSVPRETLVRIARQNVHAFGAEGAFERAREKCREAGSFLRLFADCCRLFSVPEDYFVGARALAQAIAGELTHAEIYVSPEIWKRFGLDPARVLSSIDRAFAEVEEETGCRLFLLLDSVRQWGPEAAARVLDFHEETRIGRVVGFGMGGEEDTVPARAFRQVYERARRLGLRTAIHAGEWAGAASVEEVLDELNPDRLDHGVRAAEDPRLLSRLAREKVPLCVSPSSNVATGVCPDWKSHPLPRLLEAGVAVCLGADDPTLFETSTLREYEKARETFGLGEKDLAAMRRVAARARFGAAQP